MLNFYRATSYNYNDIDYTCVCIFYKYTCIYNLSKKILLIRWVSCKWYADFLYSEPWSFFNLGTI